MNPKDTEKGITVELRHAEQEGKVDHGVSQLNKVDQDPDLVEHIVTELLSADSIHGIHDGGWDLTDQVE